MSASARIDCRSGYLHMRLPKPFHATRETVEALSQQLIDQRRAHCCVRVLCEGEVASRGMSRMDVFDAGDRLAGEIPGLTLALLLHGFEISGNAQFFRLQPRREGQVFR